MDVGRWAFRYSRCTVVLLEARGPCLLFSSLTLYLLFLEALSLNMKLTNWLRWLTSAEVTDVCRHSQLACGCCDPKLQSYACQFTDWGIISAPEFEAF